MARYSRTAVRWLCCFAVLVETTPPKAQTARVPICELLDHLTSARDRTVTVSGELVGSFYHGFFLAPEGQAETCPGWPEHGFTRHALIALGFPLNRTRGTPVIPPEFLRLDQMIRKEQLYPKVVAALRGH